MAKDVSRNSEFLCKRFTDRSLWLGFLILIYASLYIFIARFSLLVGVEVC